jgi:hypothetical protein
MENIDTTYKNINNLYTKIGFTEKYGSELWVTVIILIIFFIAIAYFYIMNNIKPIVADWENQKCNPAVIPFAGWINNGKDTTPMEFTGQNFTYCIQGILTNITAYAFQPFYYLMKVMTDAFSELGNAINGVRAEFDKIRNSMSDFTNDTMGRTLNITMPIVQMMISIKDMGAKVMGILSASVYTLMGSYLAMKSLFLFIINLIITILIILAGITVAFLIISFIPIFGSWAIPIAATNLAIFIAILIPTIMIKIFMDDIMNLSTPGTPNVPSCFDEKTLIKMKDTSIKPIVAVNVGDVLCDGTIVTGIMKLSATHQTLYNLHSIIVTGEHRVYHAENGWIKVKNHPDSIILPDFNKPFVYCLITNTKTFMVGETLFSDWDDIDADVIANITKNCLFIPPNFTNEDIHSYLDNGLHPSTKIKLMSGKELTITNIKVNDVLMGGERVIGTIKIDATKLKHGTYEYRLDNGNCILCSGNININNYLGGINTFNLYGNPILDEPPCLYLYQLLTTSGNFNVNGMNIGDYNTGIDRWGTQVCFTCP